MCYEDCSLCTVKVEKTLPCGHIQNVPCGLKSNEIICNLPCIRPLKCGHKCLAKCCEPCKPCKILVSKNSLWSICFVYSIFFLDRKSDTRLWTLNHTSM